MLRKRRGLETVRILASLAAVIVTSWATPVALAWHEDTLVVANRETSTLYVGHLAVDEEHVLWERGGVSVHSHCKEMFVSNLDDGEETPVSRIGDLGDADIDDGRVVWGSPEMACDDQGSDVAPGGLFLTDLSEGASRPLLPEAQPVAVAIVGDWVGWINREVGAGGTFNDRLLVGQIENIDEAHEIVATEPGEGTLGDLRFDGEWLTWLQYGVDGASSTLYRTHVTVNAIAEPETVEAFSTAIIAHDIAHQVLVTLEFGGETGGVVRVRNLETDVDQGYVIAEDADGGVTTDGRFVFWANQIGLNPSVLTVEGYDLLTNSRFVVAEYHEVEAQPVGYLQRVTIDDGVLAWTRWGVSQYQSEVHAAPLADRLPTAYRPNPGVEDPHRVWFSETGHYLGGEFRAYWDENGGLPVFGYPLTEEFREINADTGLKHTVQFFERQRYEWHPENVGTLYAVLLGRLGAEDAAERGLLDDPSFAPIALDAASDDCWYAPETAHASCGEFLSYWQAHGLDFGDEGVSFRESLALFGYPLSEPFMDTNEDGDSVLTQYYERAVFELHQDNPEEYRILLRRLAAEELNERGW